MLDYSHQNHNLEGHHGLVLRAGFFLEVHAKSIIWYVLTTQYYIIVVIKALCIYNAFQKHNNSRMTVTQDLLWCDQF